MHKVLVTGMGVSKEGVDVPVGEIIKVSEKSALALINEGKAQAIEVEVNTPDSNAKNQGGNEPTEEEKQVQALDAQYKRDDLYAAAKEAGVDIAYNAVKPDIIAAVIAQGFAAALIK
ncbi:hypothetical protein [Paenibacillus sp. L3-i20]|uniref:hypothetical protein n=1 Tax=Paenibacillus sp. L3-i20 TaxID=2905833 RepID=UPI001EE148BD|nr:hypothetical protein [Paenibacillus sp. L3-i20]GKU79295.1 hypothetical protein L3i20_v236920 [Paenibacillus sp. L3-i20]